MNIKKCCECREVGRTENEIEFVGEVGRGAPWRSG